MLISLLYYFLGFLSYCHCYDYYGHPLYFAASPVFVTANIMQERKLSVGKLGVEGSFFSPKLFRHRSPLGMILTAYNHDCPSLAGPVPEPEYHNQQVITTWMRNTAVVAGEHAIDHNWAHIIVTDVLGCAIRLLAVVFLWSRWGAGT